MDELAESLLRFIFNGRSCVQYFTEIDGSAEDMDILLFPSKRGLQVFFLVIFANIILVSSHR